MYNWNVVLVIYFCLQLTKAEQMIYLYIEKFDHANLTEKSIVDMHGLRLTHNHTHQSIHGTIEAFIDMDNSVQLSVALYQQQGNEYRKTAFRVPPTGFCDFVANDTYYFKNFFEHSDLKSQHDCPAIPKGVHKIDSFMIDVTEVPKFIEGKFLLLISYHHNDNIVDESHWFVDIDRYELE